MEKMTSTTEGEVKGNVQQAINNASKCIEVRYLKEYSYQYNIASFAQVISGLRCSLTQCHVGRSPRHKKCRLDIAHMNIKTAT
jgi:hypothetical protein